MKHLALATWIAVLVAPALGCVAPGSSSGSLAIRGSLRSEGGEPLDGRLVELVLPAAYGLDGLDLAFSDPADFGQQDQRFSVTTDADGAFSQDLGRRIYHVGCWILPPVGCFPKAPPPPLVLVRVPSFPGEYYAVETHDGDFEIFGLGGRELAASDAALAELHADSESSSKNGERKTVGVIELRFRNP